MIDKHNVVGIYQLDGGVVHAIVACAISLSPNRCSPRYETPYKTVCGTHSGTRSGIRSTNPGANIKAVDISEITCKKCLKRLGVIIPGNKPIKLMGTYGLDKSSPNLPVHVLVEREPRKSDNAMVVVPLLRSVCDAYPDVYRSDGPGAYPDSNEKIMAAVTCKECLAKLKSLGILPPYRQDKKFFSVFYDAGETRSIFDIDEMLDEIKRYGSDITRILLIDSYREVSMNTVTVMVGKDGKEITEEDLRKGV